MHPRPNRRELLVSLSRRECCTTGMNEARPRHKAMPKVPFRAGAEPIRHPGRSRTKVRTAGSSRRMFTSGIRSATSPRSARRLVGQFGTGTSPIWGYTGPCRAATCVPESHGSEPIQPQRAIEGHAGPHPAAPSIPAASTHFVQRYRLVARGPCSAPASELNGLSGEAVGPRPAPWSTRGPRLFKLWSGRQFSVEAAGAGSGGCHLTKRCRAGRSRDDSSP